MVHMTKEMSTAMIGLQELSASDPAVRMNMLRQLGTLTELVTGRERGFEEPGGPMFMAGFQLTAGQQQACMMLTARTGVEQVYLAFDVDDAAGPPRGLGVVRIEGDRVVAHVFCRIWVPASGGRAVIVPTGEGTRGHFAFRRGQRLRFVDRPPPGDLAAGYRRAEDRQRQLVAARELCPIEGELTRYLAEGPGLIAISEPIAA
jgi:hypothetical protein